ncbi:NUDIX hydrolase [Faecalibacter sp. LW9]|uniref:NUDIX hydrolase n=1 Tax=Faecalibacter sp. LW9 TaxID=3103144 RepID=UPI002AFF1D38|nr:NUDIX domain-containing protein [Faecalibacter sp. LW9]
MSKPFNVRVYALLEHQGKIMIIHEPFQNQLIYKFPGGGLEFGEGTRECLIREFKEELNLEVEIGEHFYTQDFFIQNVFDPTEQILMIYYCAQTTDEALENLKVMDEDIQEVMWWDKKDLNPDRMTLATDKIVIDLYQMKNFES